MESPAEAFLAGRAGPFTSVGRGLWRLMAVLVAGALAKGEGFDDTAAGFSNAGLATFPPAADTAELCLAFFNTGCDPGGVDSAPLGWESGRLFCIDARTAARRRLSEEVGAGLEALETGFGVGLAAEVASGATGLALGVLGFGFGWTAAAVTIGVCGVGFGRAAIGEGAAGLL